LINQRVHLKKIRRTKLNLKSIRDLN